MADSHECDKCGKDFDSERGLNIHKGRTHDSDSSEEQESSGETDSIEDRDREFQERSTGQPKPTSTVNYNSDSVLRFSLSAGQAALVFFLIGIFVGGFFMSAISGLGSAGAVAQDPSNPGSDNNGNDPSDTGNEPSGDTIDTSKITLEGQPMLGDKNAPVTMVLYEDFQCPFCKKFETEAFPQIVENYVKSGKVRVVWKDLPLPQLGHDWAEPAAAAMECVYRQDNDVFWSVKDKLFSSAKTLSRGQDKYTTDNIQDEIISMASDEGLSSSAIQGCIDNDNPMEEVKSDRQEAGKVGARGTPTIIINDKKVVGAQPYQAFKQVIDSELNS